MKTHKHAALFPLLEGAEFEALKQDIAENGLQMPLTRYRGQLLDGRNRLRACEELGIEPQFDDLTDDSDPLVFVVSMNLHRRHLRSEQRGRVLRELLNARGVQQGLRGRKPKNGNCATVAQLAEDVAVSERTFQRDVAAADAYDNLPKGIQAKVDAGDITVGQASKAMESMKRSPKGRKALHVLEAPEPPKKVPEEVQKVFDEHSAKASKRKTFDKWWSGVVSGFAWWEDYVLKMPQRERRCLEDGAKEIRKHLRRMGL